MKCPTIKKVLSAYIDDELAAEQRDPVRLHLIECESCRDELAQLLSLDKLFADAEKFTAPPGFSTRVLVLTCIINRYMIYSWVGGKNYAQGLPHSTLLGEGSSAD